LKRKGDKEECANKSWEGILGPGNENTGEKVLTARNTLAEKRSETVGQTRHNGKRGGPSYNVARKGIKGTGRKEEKKGGGGRV